MTRTRRILATAGAFAALAGGTAYVSHATDAPADPGTYPGPGCYPDPRQRNPDTRSIAPDGQASTLDPSPRPGGK